MKLDYFDLRVVFDVSRLTEQICREVARDEGLAGARGAGEHDLWTGVHETLDHFEDLVFWPVGRVRDGPELLPGIIGDPTYVQHGV